MSQADNRKYPQFILWFLSRPKTTAFITFLFLSCIAGFIVMQQYKIVKEDEQQEMNNIIKIFNQNLEQSLKNCYTTTLTLALTINDKGIPENFEEVSKKLLESNKIISAVQLVPQGVIKYVYPVEGNEADINLNILKDPYLKTEALKSAFSKKMYFEGPLNLKQGGTGIVGRFPVFINNKFWGFSAVIIKLDDLLKYSGITTVDDSKYDFQFSKENANTKKEVFFLSGSTDLSQKYYITATIPDGDWKLYLISKHQNYLYAPIFLLGLVGLLFAIFFGILIYNLLKIPEELQYLVNIQATKVFNSENKFQAIFDQAAVGIAHIDSATGIYIEINDQFCKLLGYSENELRQKSFQSITHPDDLAADLMNLKKLFDGEIKGYNLEKRYYNKHGAIVWVNISVSPLFKNGQKLTSFISIVVDISSKKEAKTQIKKSETRFKSLFDDSPLPVREEDFSSVKKYLFELKLCNKQPEIVEAYFINNPQEIDKCYSLIKIINVNKASLKLYKVKTKEELIQNNSDLQSVQAKKDFTKNLIAITQGHKQYSLDSVIVTAQGEHRIVNLRWNMIRGYKKTFERIIVSTEDITDRKLIENIIHKSQQRTESLINTIDGIVWECDAKTFAFTFISKKVEKILGYTAEEWLQYPTFWVDHIHPDDQKWIVEYCTMKTKENLNHNFEYRMIAKDGSIVWLRDIVNVITENNQAVSLRGIMIDVTINKKSEEELKNSFNLVTEQNKRLLNFSYIVSHNLRSQTSNIASIIELLENSESEEERNEMIQLLKSVSHSLNETMIHLNEVITIRTNIGLVSEPLNLKYYVETAQKVLSEQIYAKNVSITTNIPEDVIINYNPAYLESILYNIISNSIRYSHPDRTPVIQIQYIADDENKMLQISDNGVGIDLVKNADKIFGMYKTFTNHADSKGIGLFITKNQIDAMGGTITVESQVNIGTTFKIYIQ